MHILLGLCAVLIGDITNHPFSLYLQLLVTGGEISLIVCIVLIIKWRKWRTGTAQFLFLLNDRFKGQAGYAYFFGVLVRFFKLLLKLGSPILTNCTATCC